VCIWVIYIEECLVSYLLRVFDFLSFMFLTKIFQTLSLLLSVMVDVFGRNSQPSIPVEASEIADLIDFL